MAVVGRRLCFSDSYCPELVSRKLPSPRSFSQGITAARAAASQSPGGGKALIRPVLNGSFCHREGLGTGPAGSSCRLGDKGLLEGLRVRAGPEQAA